jgi:phosphomannomutase
MTDTRDSKVIYMFDVDGTLTAARKVILPEMKAFMKALREKVYVGVVGGSDMPKQREQLTETVFDDYDYNFAENGLSAYKDGKKVAESSFKDHIGETNLKRLLKFILHYVADLDIPVQRGTFIEFRTGMLNVSPIGRNCSQAEREAFEQYDNEHKIRATMVAALKAQFPDLGLTYSIGGQISFDVFPNGWDKTYCLKYLQQDGFTEIHFFGDKTYPGGNDYEIFSSDATVGHTVTSPQDTRAQLEALMAEKGIELSL